MADSYKLLFDGIGYKTGDERSDTAYVDGKGTVHDFSDAADGEVERLQELGAIGPEDASLPEETLAGDAVFLDTTVTPAKESNTEEQTGDENAARRAAEGADESLRLRVEESERVAAARGVELASGDEIDQLKGEELDKAVADANIEGRSSMTADEKRDALRANASESQPES